jgi:hypothetical protein
MSVVTISNAKNKTIKIVGCNFFKKEEDDECIVITVSQVESVKQEEPEQIEGLTETSQESEQYGEETGLEELSKYIKSLDENPLKDSPEPVKEIEVKSDKLEISGYTVEAPLDENSTQKFRIVAAKHCRTKTKYIGVCFASDVHSNLEASPPDLTWIAKKRPGGTRVVFVDKTLKQMEQRPTSVNLYVMKSSSLYSYSDQKAATVHSLNGELFNKKTKLDITTLTVNVSK